MISTADSADLVQNTSPRPARLAYLLAASHSGSTLMAMLLGAHPDACTVGELKATSLGDPDRYRCSCKKLIRECGFWAEIKTNMQDRGHADFDITRAGTNVHGVQSDYARRLLNPMLRGPSLEFVRDAALSLSPAWRNHLKHVQRRNLDLVRSVQEVANVRLLVDSSKVALRLKYLLQIPELEIKVIRFVRDGRAVALTYMDDWQFADAADPSLRSGGTGQRRSQKRTMQDAAREWKRSNEAADCLVARLPSHQWIQVRYEELCADPAATLQRVCVFLGLDPAKINLEFRSKEHHVIGNGMRMDSSSEIRLDERWRQHLTAEDLATFDNVAGALNRKYGYTS